MLSHQADVPLRTERICFRKESLIWSLHRLYCGADQCDKIAVINSPVIVDLPRGTRFVCYNINTGFTVLYDLRDMSRLQKPNYSERSRRAF